MNYDLRYHGAVHLNAQVLVRNVRRDLQDRQREALRWLQGRGLHRQGGTGQCLNEGNITFFSFVAA